MRQRLAGAFDAVLELPDLAEEQAGARSLVQALEGEEQGRGRATVVLDGYHFRLGYQQVIKEAGYALVCIDDIHAYPFIADLIINHAPID